MVTLHADAAIGKAVATISGRWSLNDLLIAVVAQALRLHPTMNAYVDAEHDIVQRDDVHIGFAVDADAGLVVGVLADTARLSLGGIASGRQAVQRRVVDEGRPPERGQEATFTITNLGHLGIRYFNPILPARTGGILGVGQLHRQDDSSAILPLSLTFDHRLVDGAPAARFLKTVRQLIDDVDGWPDHWGS
jgi:pyruvate dehydrogenase E2 component (dihydrolipoamide acetyltransferase)